MAYRAGRVSVVQLPRVSGYPVRVELRPGRPAEVGMSDERIGRVRDRARGWVDQGITPTLVVLAARRGVIVLHEAFGTLNAEPGGPALR